MVWDRRRAGVGLIALSIGVSAAGATIALATSAVDGPDSGIKGHVVCAIVLERDFGCSSAYARLLVRERSSDRRVAIIKPGPTGRFRMALEPGDYVIELQPPSRLSPWRKGQIPVSVAPHRFKRILVGMVPRPGPGLLRLRSAR